MFIRSKENFDKFDHEHERVRTKLHFFKFTRLKCEYQNEYDMTVHHAIGIFFCRTSWQLKSEIKSLTKLTGQWTPTHSNEIRGVKYLSFETSLELVFHKFQTLVSAQVAKQCKAMKIPIFNETVMVMMMMVCSNIHQTHSANILAFVTDHSRSHCIIMDTLMKALVERNHNVSGTNYKFRIK